MCNWIIVAQRASGDVFRCHILRLVLSLGELMSRGAKARRNFRQLERLVRTHAVGYLINKYKFTLSPQTISEYLRE